MIYFLVSMIALWASCLFGGCFLLEKGIKEAFKTKKTFTPFGLLFLGFLLMFSPIPLTYKIIAFLAG